MTSDKHRTTSKMTLLEQIKSKFPKEIQDLILDFSNPYAELKLVFTNEVLPSIITENVVFRLNQIKSKTQELENFEFINCKKIGGESFILIRHGEENLMKVFTETNETVYWEELYDNYWDDEESIYYYCSIFDLLYHLTQYEMYDIPIPGMDSSNDSEWNHELDIRMAALEW
jgi:hypothetical protein